jgi:hypothetical protein
MATSLVTTLDGYRSSDCFIQVNHDLQGVSSFHPSESLLLSGPSRPPVGAENSTEFIQKLLPIGMVLSFSYSVSVPNSPQQHIGSNRLGSMGNRPMYQWQASRVAVAGRDFMRCLHTAAVQAIAAGSADLSDDRFIRPDVEVSGVGKGLGVQWTNFESEMMAVPFGIYHLERTRDKRSRLIGYYGAYLTSFQSGSQGGQPQTIESISGWCDQRIELPYSPANMRLAFERIITGGALNEATSVDDSATR